MKFFAGILKKIKEKNPSEWALKSARLTVQRGQYIAPLRITRRTILWWGL